MLKFLKYSLGLAGFYLMIIAGASPFAGCTKTVHDTITVTKKDTINIHDTAMCGNLTDGLVAYYTFTNGSLKDSSGNNNDIYQNTAVATTDRFGKTNGAYLFNTTTSIMRVHNSASLNPQQISIMAIFKPSAFYSGTCHANEIVGKGNRDDIQGIYYMRIQDSAATCNPGQAVRADKEFVTSGFGDNSSGYRGASAGSDTAFLKTNQWYTVIYTFDGIVSKLYVNGALKDVKLFRTTFTPNTFDLTIGRHDDATYPYSFNGVVDEVRIYNKALCPEQVEGLNNLKR